MTTVITPTQWAEAAPRRALRRKWPIGPAGIPVPRADRAYLHPGEKPLLRDIALAAIVAERKREHGEARPPEHVNWQSVKSCEAIAAVSIVNEQIIFRQRHGRQPTWGEIEQQYPAIAAWLAEQRRGSK